MKPRRKTSYRVLACSLAMLFVLVMGVILDAMVDDSYAQDIVVPDLVATDQVPDPAPVFADVPAEEPWASDIYELASLGILCGTSETMFSPSRPVTTEQILISYGRLDGRDVSDFDAVVAAGVDNMLINPYLWGRENAPLDRAQGYATTFRCFGVLPACNSTKSSLYTDTQGFEYIANVMADLGLGTLDTTMSDTPMTRWEYARILNTLRKLRLESPELFSGCAFNYIPLEYVDKYAAIVPATYGYTMLVPFDVLRVYHQAGYSINIGDAAILHYVESHDLPSGTHVVGLFSTKDKCIHLRVAYGVMHEMGHFVETFMAGKNDIKPLFAAEGSAAEELLGSYSQTDSREYFGEVFRFYVQNRGDALQLDLLRALAPRTYQYFTSLEENHWLRPGATELLPNNFNK